MSERIVTVPELFAVLEGLTLPSKFVTGIARTLREANRDFFPAGVPGRGGEHGRPTTKHAARLLATILATKTASGADGVQDNLDVLYGPSLNDIFNDLAGKETGFVKVKFIDVISDIISIYSNSKGCQIQGYKKFFDNIYAVSVSISEVSLTGVISFHDGKKFRYAEKRFGCRMDISQSSQFFSITTNSLRGSVFEKISLLYSPSS